jgi:hypothetical protein
MEDETYIVPSFQVQNNRFLCGKGSLAFYSVFDGHAGKATAVTCRQAVFACLKVGLDAGKHPVTALHAAFLKSDAAAPSDGSGATACVCVVEKATGRVWTANAGDSRAVLRRSATAAAATATDTVTATAAATAAAGAVATTAAGGDDAAATVALTIDHKPNHPYELHRIQKAGGSVVIINGVPRVRYPKPGVNLLVERLLVLRHT